MLRNKGVSGARFITRYQEWVGGQNSRILVSRYYWMAPTPHLERHV